MIENFLGSFFGNERNLRIPLSKRRAGRIALAAALPITLLATACGSGRPVTADAPSASGQGLSVNVDVGQNKVQASISINKSEQDEATEVALGVADAMIIGDDAGFKKFVPVDQQSGPVHFGLSGLDKLGMKDCLNVPKEPVYRAGGIPELGLPSIAASVDLFFKKVCALIPGSSKLTDQKTNRLLVALNKANGHFVYGGRVYLQPSKVS
ncbi:hypothetical protein HY025_06160 [Candidatus Daviesbacteria bacterium]|nr:hypothetical protein [Candidatus Daviesbacteria bacterium]